VALDHYRDAFSVIYLIYAHSSNFEILTVLDIAYHAILTVLDIVYHAILTVLDIVYHAILTVLNIVYHAILTVLDIEVNKAREVVQFLFEGLSELEAPELLVLSMRVCPDDSDRCAGSLTRGPAYYQIKIPSLEGASVTTLPGLCPKAGISRVFAANDGDDEDEPSDDGKDEEVDIEADDKKEEHPAPADSTVVALPAADQAPSAEKTKIKKNLVRECRSPVPTPVWSDAEVARLLAISTPPSSPLSPWSSPLPQIPFPPLPLIPSPSLPLSPPLPVSAPPPASPIRPLGYRAAMIRLRAEAASTSHSLPLPPPIILSHTRPDAPSSGTPPLHLLSTDRREDRPEVTLPPRKRLGIALGPRYEIRESSSAAAARPAGGLRADYGFVATIDREIRRDLERDVGYGITDSWDEIVEAMQGTPVVTDVAEFSQRMTEFETRVRRDTDEVYTRLDDEQTRRQLLAGRLNMLFRDRRAHAQVMSLRTTVLAQQSEIRELQSADRRRQTLIIEMLAADHRRQK
ncbi:hypothetical protein Tco_0396070, partial [Tanacetum coccineum]